MNNDAIGLVDSGVGGFTVLRELQKSFPNEDFIYFGDSKNMPYGEKTNEEIISLVNHCIKFLTDHKVKFIILACNTASSLIDKLDSEVKLFNIIKAGSLASLDFKDEKQIGLIATRATVNNHSYDKTLKKLTDDLEYVSYGTQELARVINTQLEEINLLKENIQLAIEPILEQAPIKHLLLGCTHFPIVSQTINELYPNIELIDPARKEAELVNLYLNENGLANKEDHSGKTVIYITGNENDKINRKLLRELNIDYEKLIYLD